MARPARPGPTEPADNPHDAAQDGAHDIVVRLDELLAERGMTLTELANRVGIALPNMSILKTGKAKAIRFSTLSAICAILQCQPGDLLRYEPHQP